MGEQAPQRDGGQECGSLDVQELCLVRGWTHQRKLALPLARRGQRPSCPHSLQVSSSNLGKRRLAGRSALADGAGEASRPSRPLRLTSQMD